MAGIVRRVPWTNIVPFALLFACATGEDGDPTSLSGFSAGPSNPVTSDATTAPATTTEDSPTGDETRGTTMRDPTEIPDPPTTSGDDTMALTSTTGMVDTTGSDESSSTGPVVLCGNGTIDAPEECDGADLGGKDCAALGFSGGSLVCTAQCIYDKAMCTSPSCGDSTVDPGEECDCGQQGVNCTAAQLGNAACTTLASPNGGNYSAGTLACNSPGSCSFNKGGCQYCGDGIKNAAEQCDAADLGGASCQSQGFAGGNISCTPQCGFNTGGCSNCGNNVVDGGEACDGGNFNGQTCQSVDPGKFAGGSLQCSNCSAISTAGCNSGGCCNTGPVGVCPVGGIVNCVCANDPFCCNNSWDLACVNGAKACGAVCP